MSKDRGLFRTTGSFAAIVPDVRIRQNSPLSHPPWNVSNVQRDLSCLTQPCSTIPTTTNWMGKDLMKTDNSWERLWAFCYALLYRAGNHYDLLTTAKQKYLHYYGLYHQLNVMFFWTVVVKYHATHYIFPQKLPDFPLSFIVVFLIKIAKICHWKIRQFLKKNIVHNIFYYWHGIARVQENITLSW